FIFTIAIAVVEDVSSAVRPPSAYSNFNSRVADIMLGETGHSLDALNHRLSGGRNFLHLLLQGRTGLSDAGGQIGIPGAELRPVPVALVRHLVRKECNYHPRR